VHPSTRPAIHDVNASDCKSIGFEQIKKRIFNGDIFVLRHGLQIAGCFDEMVATSLEGIRQASGDEVADKIADVGFERIHEVMKATIFTG
jgi:hypothetical protein